MAYEYRNSNTGQTVQRETIWHRGEALPNWSRVSGPDPEQQQEQDPRSEPPAGPPARSANKAAWVDYAVAQGVDRGDAEDTAKADLIELYGGGADG